MTRLFIFLIRGYQLLLSPLLVYLFGHSCRFLPTCSEYMKDAVDKYGVVKGLRLGLRRISKCHPGHPISYDPVR